ncbi:hypothetical protein DA2_0203 [Desulfovibrio sp. A2]|nr:hypothetical protein DA2_0203 [Desulfovibrio sp. A2]
MSVTLTAAGEALIARLQAEGTPLVIDRFIFADVPGQDHTQPASPAQGVPTANVVHAFPIPPEYRAFVAPNQVVYSALLGSDVGPFSFNWQGLYCTEHATLVAVATFPRLEKRRYDPATNTQGNNLTRNFLLEFSGARELTQITVEAAVWQLDFTVRLKGIDERERLSNRDIYGRAAFLDDGWLLTHTGGAYRFEAGRGYVEGIRAALQEPAPVVPTVTPCEVWLDVSMQGQGSDVVTVVTPLCLAIGTDSPDYVAAAPHNTQHYCEKVARIEADGSVTDLRPRRIGIAPELMGAVTHEELEVLATALGGKVDRSDWVTLVPDRAWRRPDGLIEQVGTVSTVNGMASVLWPVAFPVMLLDVQLTDKAATSFRSASIVAIDWSTATNSGMTVYAQTDGAAAVNDTFGYRALGR